MADPTKTVTNPRIGKLIQYEDKLDAADRAELETYRAQGLAPPKSSGPKLTEDQAKSTGFYDRARTADVNFLNTGTDAKGQPAGMGPRGMVGQYMSINHPDMLNSLPEGMGNSPERQLSDQAQREFINAVLRRDSGAVISPEEMDNYGRTYFPAPGDGPEVIGQKAKSRQIAIDGLKVAAGPGTQVVTGPTTGDIGFNVPRGPEQSARGGQIGFGAQQQAAYDAFLQHNPKASAAELRAFGTSIGAPIANADDIVSARDKGAGVRPAADAIVRPAPAQTSVGDAFARGAGDAAMLGTLDEVGGLADTVKQAATGDLGRASFLDNLYSNIDLRRAQLNADRDKHPLASLAGGIVGGSVIPIGAGARTAGEIGRAAAVGGALYGFGSGEGDIIDRAPSVAGGALAGAVGGYGVGRAAPFVGGVLSRMTAPAAGRAEASVLGGAAERQGVPLTAADVRPGARNALAFLEASPCGNGPVRSALDAGNDAMADGVLRLGGNGRAGTPASIGDTIQGAGRRAIDITGQRKNTLYDRAETLAGDHTVTSNDAIGELDRHIGELSQTPNANRGVLGLLGDLRDDLVDENGIPRALSVNAIRNLRTAMRGEIGTRNLTMTDAERRISDVIDAASDDITHSLRDAGRGEAADAYRMADNYYRGRQTAITDVIQRFLGRRDQPISGEQAYTRLTNMMKPGGDSRRLGEMMRTLTDDEQSDVAATIAGQLGRRAPDEDFSPARFVTMAQKMSPEARQTVFGADGANAIDDLIQIASARRDTIARLNNSRSGQVSNYNTFLSGALGMLGAGGGYAATGGVGGAAAGAVAAGAAKAGVLNLSARLLTNQPFVRWLARAPSANTPAEMAAHVRQLGAVAARQPAVRGEIEQIERLLSADMTRASAQSDQEQRERP